MADALAQTLPPADEDAPADLVDATVEEVEEMNGDGWWTLVENDVADEPVRLDFQFSAPNEPGAAELAEFLQTVGYGAATSAPASDIEDWTVRGTSAEAGTDEPGLAEWVRRMSAAGWSHGECTFDGWTLVIE